MHCYCRYIRYTRWGLGAVLRSPIGNAGVRYEDILGVFNARPHPVAINQFLPSLCVQRRKINESMKSFFREIMIHTVVTVEIADILSLRYRSRLQSCLRRWDAGVRYNHISAASYESIMINQPATPDYQPPLPTLATPSLYNKKRESFPYACKNGESINSSGNHDACMHAA